ncbi:MAG TPA: transmembrane 220 family protein [Candidatus Eisenbacteria bacterium]|nr:transmembrane 220 family protein [Candidatus Eisenbacteria bacterium]
MRRAAFLRGMHWIMAAAFALSVVVQYNDPDPLPWMAIYGAATVVAFWAALRPRSYPWWVPAIVGAVATVWAARLVRQVTGRVWIPELFASWEMKNARVELEREIGGLLVVLGWMTITALAAFFRDRPVPMADPELTRMGHGPRIRSR